MEFTSDDVEAWFVKGRVSQPQNLEMGVRLESIGLEEACLCATLPPHLLLESSLQSQRQMSESRVSNP